MAPQTKEQVNPKSGSDADFRSLDIKKLEPFIQRAAGPFRVKVLDTKNVDVVATALEGAGRT